MGTAESKAFRYLKAVYYNYNSQYRALKLLDRKKLPPPPRYDTTERLLQDIPKEKLKELHEKDMQLNEYLKNVYLTSTDEGKKVTTSRALPVKKETESEIIFYEPSQPKQDCTTLSSIVNMLHQYQKNPNLKVAELALEYNLQKESVKNLLIYYSLFKKEDFSFINKEEVQEKQGKDGADEKKTMTFEVFRKVEEPLKQIEDKK